MDKKILCLIIAAFLIRLIPIFSIAFLKTNNALYDGDSGGYNVMGKAFANGDFLFKEDQARLTSIYRTPGYPIFLGVFYFLSFSDLHIAVIQAFLDSIALFFIYKTAQTIFGDNVAVFAAILYALNPTMILFSFKILTESIFNFIFIITNYYFVQALYSREKAGQKTALIIGILFSILAIIRPVGIFFSLIYAIILFIKSRQLKPAFLIFMPSLLLPALWVFRNSQVLGYAIYSGIPELNTLCWQATFMANENVNMQKWGSFIDEYKLKNYDECNKLPYEKVRQGSPIAVNFILDNWAIYLKLFAKAIIVFFAPATPNYLLTAFGSENQAVHFSNILFKSGLDIAKIIEIIIQRPLYLILFGFSVIYELALYGYFILGTINAIREKKHNYLLLLLILLFVYTILSAGLVSILSSYRYRMPIEMFLIIIAANYACYKK